MSDTVAPIYELVIGQGATLTRSFVWKDANGVPIPLTDFIARMQVREDFDSTPKILDISSDVVDGQDGTLTITEAAGRITLVVPADRTADLDFEEAVWDLEVESPAGEVTRLVQGPAMLDREVTK